MNDVKSFSLESIRTDGWFERVGEGIGSFQALCDIVGPPFVAFAIITGARITALTVDRGNPDSTLVDFTAGGEDTDTIHPETKRLTLAEFHERLVAALLADDEPGAVPERETDSEGLQRHIGVRYLLLAPLYGYSLLELRASARGSHVRVRFDGVDEVYSLAGLRARLRAHVREELNRARRAAGAVDLARVAEAEAASLRGEAVRVLELLGAWPAPLAILLRTPEGQALGPEVRSTIARGLGLLGSSCIKLGDVDKGEEILRLAIQYAGDGPEAADIYRRLGESAFHDGRPGESIAALRRAANLGAPAATVWPLLAAAFSARGRHLAALSAVLEGIEAGVAVERFEQPLRSLAMALGDPLQAWVALVKPEGLPLELLGLTGYGAGH